MNISICAQCESEIIEPITNELGLTKCYCQEIVHTEDGSFASDYEKRYMNQFKQSRRTRELGLPSAREKIEQNPSTDQESS